MLAKPFTFYKSAFFSAFSSGCASFAFGSDERRAVAMKGEL